MERTPSYLTSLKKESVVQSVINRLTEGMRRGELKPGDKIPTEPELSESLGVARSSVREAIKILTYLGVLESKRHEGTFVCSGFEESMIDPMVYGIILNKDSFENLMELREMTETGMMRLAIKHHDEQDVAELEAILEEMEQILSGTDCNDEESIKAFFEADDKFHDKIADTGRNPMADKINRVVRTLTYAIRYETVSSMLAGGKGSALLETHRELLDAIKQGEENVINEKVRESYFESELLERREGVNRKRSGHFSN